MHDRPGLVGRAWYDTVYLTAFAFFTAGFSLRLAGWANIPRRGPVLLVANHQSMFDPVLIGLCSRRYLTFLARSTLFDVPILGAAIRSLNAVPIDRSVGKDGITRVAAALERGAAVLMFPEGERTRTGAVQPLKPGVSLLTRRVTCPIVPVGIAGCYAAWSRHHGLPAFSPLVFPPRASTIALSVGEPIDPARYAGKAREWVVEDLHRELVAQHAAADALRRK